MSEDSWTRRTYMKGLGTTALAATSLPVAASGSSKWAVAETPTEENLYDVAFASDGAYAVGGGGVVLKRTSAGWTKILDGGPGGNGNTLKAADVTDGGDRLWFAGNSGAIGEYDVTTGNLNDRSGPNDSGDNFNDIGVRGQAGEADVHVACDSGHVHYSFDNGKTQTWEYVTPGSGAALNGIDFFGKREGHLVDENQTVFVTDDGETWDVIGLANAGVNFYGVDSDGLDDVYVSGGGGMIFHWDGSGWTPSDTGDADLRDVEVADDGGDGLTVGGGGKVYDLSGGKWTQESTPTGANLTAVARGSVDVAVGASGTVLES
jgi:hypothetical protein